MKIPMVVFSFIVAILLDIRAQDEGFHELEPEIIDRRTLAEQHYDKKGYTVVSGDLSGLEFAYKKLLVLDSAYIPLNASFATPDAVDFYFEPEAVLKVDGRFRAAGTQSNPINFSLVPGFDLLYNAQVTSKVWQGIYVGEQGSLVLNHAAIREAANGIIARGVCDSLELTHVHFENIDDTPLHIDGQAVEAKPLSDYSLECATPQKASRKEPIQRKRRLMSNTLFGVAAGLAVTGILLDIFAFSADEQVRSATSREDARHYKDNAQLLNQAGNAALIASGACFVPAVVLRIPLGTNK
ncbi:MAG: hypothetical protein GF398_21440 [Chitinivibrionales bacterium]|nr:hypothetical protein [Chitinivibrionales bacterium]